MTEARNRLFQLATCLSLVVGMLGLLAPTADAQDENWDFRDSRTYLGIGAGIYTFHGPVDLWKPRSFANFVRKKDPAVMASILFPVSPTRLYLRPQIGYTFADRQYGERLLISGENEFIVNDLAWFETDLLVFLRHPRHRVIPYLFGGVGLLLADPFGRTTAHRDSIPAEHVKRTQVYFPVGIGVDLAMTRRLSLFVEGGLRLSRNSVFIDRAEPDPFNTTLVAAGLRFALGTREKPVYERPSCPDCPICKTCVPILIPVPPVEDCCSCNLVDLQEVYFDFGFAVLDSAARRELDININAVLADEDSDCLLRVQGFYDDGEDQTLADRRATQVYWYYRENGIPETRIRLDRPERGLNTCSKKDESLCQNRIVRTTPMCGFEPICKNSDPPAPYTRMNLHGN